MPSQTQKAARNQSMECCKMIAALFVVLIHVKFPGKTGEIATCLARFAVPLFFGISGYFNLHASLPQIRRRLVHIGKLTLLSFFLCILWGCYRAEFVSIRDFWIFLFREGRAIPELLLLQASPYPYSGHLWYLLSLMLCYLVLWGYTCFWQNGELSYTNLYRAGFSLFAVYFTLSILLPMEGMEIPFRAYRSGWLTGIPMFLMGMFLRQYQQRIWDNFHLTGKKLAALVLLGILLSLLSWKGGFTPEIPLGTMLEVPALILLMAKYPRIPIKAPWFQSLTDKFGTLSTAVYVLHLMVLDMYEQYLLPTMETQFGGRELWLRPIAVIALSLMTAVVWERAVWLRKQLSRKPN